MKVKEFMHISRIKLEKSFFVCFTFVVVKMQLETFFLTFLQIKRNTLCFKVLLIQLRYMSTLLVKPDTSVFPTEIT